MEEKERGNVLALIMYELACLEGVGVASRQCVFGGKLLPTLNTNVFFTKVETFHQVWQAFSKEPQD